MRGTIRRGFLAIAIAIGVHAAAVFPVRAAPIDYVGIDKALVVLWPVVAITYPFFALKNAIFGTDDEAITNSNGKTAKLIKEFKGPVVADSVFGESLAMSDWGVYGLLVFNKLHFVESTTADALWLLKYSAEPEKLAQTARQHLYVRFRLGLADEAGCLKWKSNSDSWFSKMPLRPDTCLVVQFVDAPQSRYSIRLDSTNAGKREMFWELFDREREASVIKLPFWNRQVEGRPLQVDTRYYNNGGGGYSSLLSLLKPQTRVTDRSGRPYVLYWQGEPPFTGKPVKLIRDQSVVATVRTATGDWVTKRRLQQEGYTSNWVDLYRRGVQTGEPVLGRNADVFIPRDERVATFSVQEYGPMFLTRCCFVRVRNDGLFDGNHITLTALELKPSSTGKAIWDHIVIPEGKVSYKGKGFLASAAHIEGQNLVIWVSDLNEEWVIPLDRLPDLSLQ
jgi:hypothetical protein